MKPIYTVLLATVAGCSPRIFYLGETYPPYQPHNIEVYFDEKQINRSYQVMGTLADSGGSLASQEKVQQAMIDKAKAVGADAIVFNDIDVAHTENSSVLILKAKAIRYN